MICKECRHKPHTSRIIFDIGSGNTSVYDLCNNCKDFSVFKEYLISQEPINKNTPVLEMLN